MFLRAIDRSHYHYDIPLKVRNPRLRIGAAQSILTDVYRDLSPIPRKPSSWMTSVTVADFRVLIPPRKPISSCYSTIQQWARWPN